MNLAMKSFRSGIATSWQGIRTESNELHPCETVGCCQSAKSRC